MGRKKIQIKKIEDERVRKVTFSKRKGGLVKKAMELSLLCDCDIGLIIFTPKPDQKLYKYATTRMEQVVQKYRNTQRAVETFNNGDYHNLYEKKGGAKRVDSDDENAGEPVNHAGLAMPVQGMPPATSYGMPPLPNSQLQPDAVFGSQAKWAVPPPIPTPKNATRPGDDLKPANRNVRDLSITIPGQESINVSGPDSLMACGDVAEATPGMLKHLVSPMGALESPSGFFGLKDKTPVGATPTAFANFSWSPAAAKSGDAAPSTAENPPCAPEAE